MEQLQKQVNVIESDAKEHSKLLGKLENLPDLISRQFKILDEIRDAIALVRIELAKKRDSSDCNAEHDRCLKKPNNNGVNSKERKAYMEVIRALAIGLSSAILALMGRSLFIAG